MEGAAVLRLEEHEPVRRLDIRSNRTPLEMTAYRFSVGMTAFRRRGNREGRESVSARQSRWFLIRHSVISAARLDLGAILLAVNFNAAEAAVLFGV